MKTVKQFLIESMQAKIIKKYGLTQVGKSIGFSEKEQKWFGWSHRAIMDFGIGDKIFDENFGDERTHFRKHGKKTIKTLDDAKLAAERFRDYVS